ncbi:hypothetical protein NtRootA9_32780 [Arthrobacter sp. NtRootA9]|nr:hypothetical protein NtRootA9_32780 [Arthrobacter sp. NtRootA9]
MDVCDDVRPGVIEDLVATLEILEVFLEREVPALQHGAHGPVRNDHPLVDRVQEFLRAGGPGDGLYIKSKTGHLIRLRAGADTLRCVSKCYAVRGSLREVVSQAFLVRWLSTRIWTSGSLGRAGDDHRPYSYGAVEGRRPRSQLAADQVLLRRDQKRNGYTRWHAVALGFITRGGLRRGVFN